MAPTSEAAKDTEKPKQASVGSASRMVRLCAIVISAIYVYLIGWFLSEPSENWFVGIGNFIVNFDYKMAVDRIEMLAVLFGVFLLPSSIALYWYVINIGRRRRGYQHSWISALVSVFGLLWSLWFIYVASQL
jgi:hypothetical protein